MCIPLLIVMIVSLLFGFWSCVFELHSLVPPLPTGSLLDFLKSDEGGKVLLPKLIDFSAQVKY